MTTNHSSPVTELALAQFAKWAIETGPFDGCELDGGDVQAKAAELGLIVPSEQRQDWWVYAPALLEALARHAQRAPDVFTRKLVFEAMQDAWNTICSDTGCHPDDIQHRGKKLFFEPGHWAEHVAMLLFEAKSQTPAQPTLEGMARLSASEVACYRWSEDTADHRAMRAAFCDGAAHTAVTSTERPNPTRLPPTGCLCRNDFERSHCAYEKRGECTRVAVTSTVQHPVENKDGGAS